MSRTPWILGVWFVAAFLVSLSGWLERFSSATLLAAGPVIIGGGFPLLYWLSPAFRQYLHSLPLKTVTLMQLARLFGLLAFVKAYQWVLPVSFAVPTGIFDVSIALSAIYVARTLLSDEGRPLPGFFVWHAVGVLGFAIPVALGILTANPGSDLVQHGVTSQPLSRFPMSLVPAFIGPLVLISHLTALAAAFRSREMGENQTWIRSRTPIPQARPNSLP